MKVLEKIKTHILCSVIFSENRVYEKMSKENVGARQDAENMAPAHGILLDKQASTRPRPSTYPPPPTHTHTHSHKHVILIDFHGNSCLVNAPQCYVMRTLPVLFSFRCQLHAQTVYMTAYSLLLQHVST